MGVLKAVHHSLLTAHRSYELNACLWPLGGIVNHKHMTLISNIHSHMEATTVVLELAQRILFIVHIHINFLFLV